MTREQIRNALDRVLGISSPERMLRDLNSSIMKKRQATTPMREFRAADLNVIGNLFRELRTAAAKSSGRR
ncbi:MAG TPA: hypothetical protein VLU46_13400 [Thermoanaerobaculia bacterium]|nr:hypothetical protein [Thermoanaerobaculia bacterium]